MVASKTASSGPRVTVLEDGVDPHARLTDLGFFQATLKADNQESRDRTMALYGDAAAKGQLFSPMKTVSRFVHDSARNCVDYAAARSSDRWVTMSEMNKYMEDTGKMLAFYAGIEDPQADAGLKAGLLTR